MRVLIYEFVTGGGLHQVQPRGLPVQSLVREGRAMVQALAEDFASLRGVQLTALHDSRFGPLHVPPGTLLRPVRHADEEQECLAGLAAQSDWTVIIAPSWAARCGTAAGLSSAAAAGCSAPHQN